MIETETLPRGLRNLVLLCLLIPFYASAQAPDEVAERVPITDAMSAEFQEQIETISRQRDEMIAIESRLAAADDAMAATLQQRLEQERIEVIEASLAFARAVATQDEAGYIVDDYRSTATDALLANLAIADDVWDQLDARAAFPAPDLSAAEQAAANLRFSETLRSINRVIVLSADSLELLDSFGSAQPDAEAAFRERVLARAVDNSIFLDRAVGEAAALRAASNAVPDDAEVTAKSRLADSLVEQVAAAFERPLARIEAYEVDTSAYRQQLLAATGEITPDVVSFAIVRDLLAGWGNTLLEFLSEHGVTFLFRALLFLLIVFIAFKASRIVRVVVRRGVEQSRAPLSELLKRMIVAVAANLVLAVGLLIALGQVGISLGPLLAGLGIAGFIVGFALQDSLANFASGMMILFYRPYDVGDIVEVGGVTGKVAHMSLVNTTINTFDNQRIVVPNSMIWGSTIKNVTAETVRRVDMVFGISYADDIPRTEQLLEEIVGSHELVLDDPAPVVKLHELADSSVNFVVRPWAQTANYWDVYWDITRAVKMRFDEAGISIPFPQRDVHIYTESADEPDNESTAEPANESATTSESASGSEPKSAKTLETPAVADAQPRS